MRRTERLWRRARDLFFHMAHSLCVCRCIACGEVIAEEDVFCSDCAEEYRAAKLSECGICGRSLSRCLCADTAFDGSPVHKHLKLYRYLSDDFDAVGNRILYRMKTRDVNMRFRFLGSELAERAKELLPLDESFLISFVPRTRARVLEHGFDQSECLARELSYALSLPFSPLLHRTRGGKTQKALPTSAARTANAEESLRLKKSAQSTVEGRRVLLVDDLVTSGASMRTAAKLIRHAGAREVIAVSVAVVTHTRNLALEAEKNSRLPFYMR